MRVIACVLHCCENFCETSRVLFSRHTIVVTAMTGVAVINVNGETTSRACKLMAKNLVRCEKWMDETCLLTVDEMSF